MENMPSWKKVITSGSSAELNSLKLTGVVNAGTDTDKFLVLDVAGNIDFRTGANVLSDIGASSNTSIPQIIVTSAEVLEEGSTLVYVPWSGINIFPESNTTAYTRFHAPYNGYIKEIIVHPHDSATSGTCTITPNINGTVKTSQQETISGTAGTKTTFTFGAAGYSFSDGNYIYLEFDRESPDRARGYAFSIVLIIDATS
jgi:hypothetical protein